MDLLKSVLHRVLKRLKKFNRVLIYLTLSDVFSWGAFSVISSFMSLYLANKLGEDVLKFVGIGLCIYFLTRAIFQVPLGVITDKFKKDKDEILILFVGIILMGIPFQFYPFITQPIQYYLLQFIFGLGVSFNLTNWRKLFALNINEGREGMSYGIYEMFMSIAIAGMSIVGGIIANMGPTYFDTVVTIAGIIIMSGSLWILLIYRYEKRNSSKK